MDWRKISLAPWRYRNVLQERGGPISSLSVREILYWGQPAYEAYAELPPQYAPQSESSLYGRVHGSGTHALRSQAIYRAASEAIERWAFFESLSQYPNSYGFYLDPSTTGMAAFPGLTEKSARPIAYYEAAERWSLMAWWEKRIDHKQLLRDLSSGINGIEILSPIPNVATVILWKEEASFTAYGFAGHKNLSLAIKKALVELWRNCTILSDYQKNPKIIPGTINERRLLHFAVKDGRRDFVARISNTQSFSGASVEKPRLLIDEPIAGPWSSYAFVWRCLFDSSELLGSESTNDNYFLF